MACASGKQRQQRDDNTYHSSHGTLPEFLALSRWLWAVMRRKQFVVGLKKRR
jgi:hypothetical protein